jgi:hypothetical protein
MFLFLDERKLKKKETVQREEEEEDLKLGLIETRLNSFKVHSNEKKKNTYEDIT